MFGFHDIFHKGQQFAKANRKLPAKFCRILCKILYHCDIPLTADIDESVWFCHNGFGIVINPNVKIGRGCIIQHSVTIGELRGDHLAPEIGEQVFIGARSILLGNIKIGNGAKIGAGTVVLSDVPDGCTIVGPPPRMINSDATANSVKVSSNR